MKTVEIKISNIQLGTRHRKDMGDIKALAQSLQEEGLLQPIGITPDHVLVFGERRLRAYRDILGRDTIQARIVDVQSVLLGQLTENTMRKDYTPSELVAVVDALRSFSHGGDRRSDQVLKCDVETLTVDAAAKRVGLGGKDGYNRAKTVVEKGVPELVESMDSGRLTISAASEIAKLPPEDQRESVRLGRRADAGHQGGDDDDSPLELSLSDRAAILRAGRQSHEHGIVYTPPHVAQFLFDLLSPLGPRIVLDVASGNGALSRPWRDLSKVIEYELAFGNDFFTSPDFIESDLVLCNPPFGHEKQFLRRIFNVVPQTTPVVLFATHRVRLGSYASSDDWRWCRDEWPPISSLISLPRGVFKGVNDTVEILAFRLPHLLPHYFMKDRDHDLQGGD